MLENPLDVAWNNFKYLKFAVEQITSVWQINSYKSFNLQIYIPHIDLLPLAYFW